MVHLARVYEKKELYGIAAELYKEAAVNKSIAHGDTIVRYVTEFFDNLAKANSKSRKEALGEALALVNHDLRYLFTFGTKLILKEYYDEAYRVFEGFNKIYHQEKYATLLMMAIAWRGSGQTPERKNAILKDLEAFHIEGWYNSVIKFLLGDVDEETILRAVDDINKACEIHYFIGLAKSIEGKKDEALKHLLISLETNAAHNIEYRYAHAKLKEIAASLG